MSSHERSIALSPRVPGPAGAKVGVRRHGNGVAAEVDMMVNDDVADKVGVFGEGLDPHVIDLRRKSSL